MPFTASMAGYDEEEADAVEESCNQLGAERKVKTPYMIVLIALTVE